MNKDQVVVWCNELKEAWIAKNYNEVKKIFSATKYYFEDPFSAPGTTIEEIRSYWDEIEFQDINELVIQPLVIENMRSVLHWYLSYRDTRDATEHEMDGTYYVEFNENAECLLFKQWWVNKL